MSDPNMEVDEDDDLDVLGMQEEVTTFFETCPDGVAVVIWTPCEVILPPTAHMFTRGACVRA